MTATNPITQQVINTAAADIPSQRDGGSTATGESPAGDLIADAQRFYAHTDLAFVNTGSIRAGLSRPVQVTYGDLFTMQPFQDDIRRHGQPDRRSRVGVAATAVGRRHRRHHADLRAALHLHGQPRDAEARSRECGSARPAITAHQIPNDTSASYTGTANSFVVGGGDGFTVLERREQHRADRRRRARSARRLCGYVAEPVPVHHRRTDRDRLRSRTTRRATAFALCERGRALCRGALRGYEGGTAGRTGRTMPRSCSGVITLAGVRPRAAP